MPTICDVKPKATEPNYEAIRHLGMRQAAAIGEVAVEGMPISPAVADEFLMRHNLGHVAIEITDEPLDAKVLIEELLNVA